MLTQFNAVVVDSFLISIEFILDFLSKYIERDAKKMWIKWFMFLVNLHSYGTTIIKRAVHFLPYHLFSQNLAERLVLICYNDISILLIALRCYQMCKAVFSFGILPPFLHLELWSLTIPSPSRQESSLDGQSSFLRIFIFTIYS